MLKLLLDHSLKTEAPPGWHYSSCDACQNCISCPASLLFKPKKYMIFPIVKTVCDKHFGFIFLCNYAFSFYLCVKMYNFLFYYEKLCDKHFKVHEKCM